MIKYYFDMDGCLAEYRWGTPFEALYNENYFYSLKPNESILTAAKRLIILKEKYPIDVFSLSAVLSDHETALQEKIAWLDKYIPELDEEHRIFTTVGENKSDHIKIGKDCVLIDDFSNNIKDFIDNKGHAVKVSRNFTDMIYEEAKHEFNHFINPSMSADDITGYLLGFLQYEDTINYFE